MPLFDVLHIMDTLHYNNLMRLGFRSFFLLCSFFLVFFFSFLSAWADTGGRLGVVFRGNCYKDGWQTKRNCFGFFLSEFARCWFGIRGGKAKNFLQRYLCLSSSFLFSLFDASQSNESVRVSLALISGGFHVCFFQESGVYEVLQALREG